MNTTKIREFLKMDFNYKQSLLFYIAFFSLFLFPIINNDIPYRDDQVRILRGNDWAFMGRNMADLVMHILTFSYDTVANISPLTFILSIVAMSCTLTNFLQKSLLKSDFINHLSLSLIFISPFYLQNLSYQYDNLTMTLGVCSVITAFAIQWNKYQSMIASILLLTIGAFFFQPVSNIFVLLVIFNMLAGIKNEDDKLKEVFKGGLIYIIAISLYYAIFKHYFEISIEDRAQLVPLHDLGNTYIKAGGILGKFFEAFTYSPVTIFIVLSLTIFIVSLIIQLFKEKTSIYIKIFTLVSPLFIAIYLWGPFIMLDETFARPREFVSIGAIIALIFIYNNKKAEKISKINNFIVLATCLFCVSLCYQYANLSKQESSYDNMLTEWISKDMNSHKELYTNKLVYLNSHPDYAPGSKVVLDNQPFLQYIQMPYYNWFSRFELENRGTRNVYKDLTNIDDSYDWNAICKNKTAKLIVENKYYNIYIINNPRLQVVNHVSIWFKRSDDLCKDRPNIKFRRNLFFIEKSGLN